MKFEKAPKTQMFALFLCNAAIAVVMAFGAGPACNSEGQPAQEIPLTQLATIDDLRSMCISGFQNDEEERHCLDVTGEGEFQLRVANLCLSVFSGNTNYDQYKLRCLEAIRDHRYGQPELDKVIACINQSAPSAHLGRVNCFTWFAGEFEEEGSDVQSSDAGETPVIP